MRFGFGRTETEREPKIEIGEGGEGGGGEGNANPNPFFPTRYPFYAPLLAPFYFFVRSLTVVPRSLLRDRTENLATHTHSLSPPIFALNRSIISQFTRL